MDDTTIKQQIPEWCSERMLDMVKEHLGTNDELVVDWVITKPAMIAVVNYIRNNGYAATWIEKGKDQFIIKFTTNG